MKNKTTILSLKPKMPVIRRVSSAHRDPKSIEKLKKVKKFYATGFKNKRKRTSKSQRNAVKRGARSKTTNIPDSREYRKSSFLENNIFPKNGKNSLFDSHDNKSSSSTILKKKNSQPSFLSSQKSTLSYFYKKKKASGQVLSFIAKRSSNVTTKKEEKRMREEGNDDSSKTVKQRQSRVNTMNCYPHSPIKRRKHKKKGGREQKFNLEAKQSIITKVENAINLSTITNLKDDLSDLRKHSPTKSFRISSNKDRLLSACKKKQREYFSSDKKKKISKFGKLFANPKNFMKLKKIKKTQKKMPKPENLEEIEEEDKIEKEEKLLKDTNGLEFKKLIGKGAYACVYQAFDNNSKDMVAVKAYKKGKLDCLWKREIQVLNSLGEIIEHRKHKFVSGLCPMIRYINTRQYVSFNFFNKKAKNIF